MLYLYSNSNVYIQLNHCESTVKSIYLYITIIVLLQYYCVILQRAVTVGTADDDGVDNNYIEKSGTLQTEERVKKIERITANRPAASNLIFSI